MLRGAQLGTWVHCSELWVLQRLEQDSDLATGAEWIILLSVLAASHCFAWENPHLHPALKSPVLLGSAK
jgi:hypothetical protein